MFQRCCLILLVSMFGAAAQAADCVVCEVSVSSATLNTSSGDSVELRFETTTPGEVSVRVLDRDGFVVRKLYPHSQRLIAGSQSVRWDGKDDAGIPVADEAYSFYIELRAHEQVHSYLPAAAAPEMFEVAARYYDKNASVLSYILPRPSRVHMQAGFSTTDPNTGDISGGVLKTIVNRAPRAAGSVSEYWTGYDESGEIYVPDVPGFATAIMATSLPENSVITYGNREREFTEQARARLSTSVLALPRAHHHHSGLGVFEDLSPDLTIGLHDASFSPQQARWSTTDRSVTLELKLAGPSAAAFRLQPGTVFVFYEYELIHEAKADAELIEITLPEKLTTSPRLLTVNWRSEYGPLAADSVLIQVDRLVDASGTGR